MGKAQMRKYSEKLQDSLRPAGQTMSDGVDVHARNRWGLVRRLLPTLPTGDVHDNASHVSQGFHSHRRLGGDACHCRRGVALVQRRPSAPANAQPLSTLLKQVEDAGYKIIVEVEFEDGVYQVEALDAQGKEIRLQVDPMSGKVAAK